MRRNVAIAVLVAIVVALWIADPSPDRSESPLKDDSIELVLAASWQPGFCATAAGRNKSECRNLTERHPAATRFSIHGLWPDDLHDTAIYPCNCDSGAPTSCREKRPGLGPNLSAQVMEELQALMPGVESGLHRHEWNKHGSCYEDDVTGADRGADADEYFSETMALIRQLNASAVRQIFADNLGQTLTRNQIRAAFDDAFGAGAGERVRVICKSAGGGRVVTELWINLDAGVTEDSDLGALILSAPTTEVSSADRGCAGGKVVRAPS